MPIGGLKIVFDVSLRYRLRKEELAEMLIKFDDEKGQQSLGGSKKPSTTTQSTSKPTAIAQASSSPLAEIVDPGDECEASCEEELEGEGDGVKASDLDGES